MKFYIPTIEEVLDNKLYEVIIENIKEGEMDRLCQNFDADGQFSRDSYEDDELVISIFKEDWGFTKAEFIKEVRRISKKK